MPRRNGPPREDSRAGGKVLVSLGDWSAVEVKCASTRAPKVYFWNRSLNQTTYKAPQAMQDAGLVKSSWDMTPPQALSGATRREAPPSTVPNPFAAEFVPGSTIYGHDSAEFMADSEEQWFPLNDDYQHTGEMAYGYYDDYTQSADANGFGMEYETYGYESYGDQAVDAGYSYSEPIEEEMPSEKAQTFLRPAVASTSKANEEPKADLPKSDVDVFGDDKYAPAWVKRKAEEEKGSGE
jgi:hypothetical protein